MKKTLFASALFFVFHASIAQTWEFGVKAGVNASNCNNIDTDFIFGFSTGAFGSLHLGKIIFQPELLYSQQGGSARLEFRDNHNVPMGSADVKTKVNYLNVPLLIKFSPWKRINLLGGPQVGFPVAAKIQTSMANGAFNTDLMRSTQTVFSAIAGVGYEFDNGLTLDTRYDFGLTNIFKSDGLDRKNRVIQFTVGYKLLRKK